MVEAALKSGSLITARYAVEQDREVFAIPGSIHNPQSRGCHQLIKQGAHLVEKAQDIVEQLAAALGGLALNTSPSLMQTMPVSAVHKKLDADELKLLSQLGFEPRDMDSLIKDGSFSVAELSRLLVALEIKDLVESRNGIYQRMR